MHPGRPGHTPARADGLASKWSPQGKSDQLFTSATPGAVIRQRVTATRLHLRDRTPAVAGRKASAALSRSHARRSGARHTASPHRGGGSEAHAEACTPQEQQPLYAPRRLARPARPALNSRTHGSHRWLAVVLERTDTAERHHRATRPFAIFRDLPLKGG